MKKKWRAFKEAREFVRSLKLKNLMDWKNYVKSGKKPGDVPSNPWEVYKEGKNLGDWLGTEMIAYQNREYKSFEDARKFVRSLKLKGQSEWSKYSKSGKRPIDIPGLPHRFYKNQGWISYGDFLGTYNVSNRDKIFISYKKYK